MVMVIGDNDGNVVQRFLQIKEIYVTLKCLLEKILFQKRVLKSNMSAKIGIARERKNLKKFDFYNIYLYYLFFV